MVQLSKHLEKCPVMEGRVLSIECEFVSQLPVGVIACHGVCLIAYVFVVVMAEGTEGKSAIQVSRSKFFLAVLCIFCLTRLHSG